MDPENKQQEQEHWGTMECPKCGEIVYRVMLWRHNEKDHREEDEIKFPIHENEYLDQIRALDSTHQFTAMEKLMLVEFKIKNHMARGTFTDCDMCASEVLW